MIVATFPQKLLARDMQQTMRWPDKSVISSFTQMLIVAAEEQAGDTEDETSSEYGIVRDDDEPLAQYVSMK